MSNKTIQELYPIGTELVVKDECVMIYIKEKTLTIGKKYVVLDNSLDDCIMIVNDQGHSHKFPIEDVRHFFDVLPKSEDTPQESTPSRQLTAVEWLFDRYVENAGIITPEQLEQALAMEKEQIKEAMSAQATQYTTPYINSDRQPCISYDIDDSFDDYYNSLYGKEEKQ